MKRVCTLTLYDLPVNLVCKQFCYFSTAGFHPGANYSTPQGQGYPQYGAGYPAGQGFPNTSGPPQTVIVQQPTSVSFQHFGELPVQMVCPTCQATVVTGIEYDSGTLTWLVCAVLCLVG